MGRATLNKMYPKNFWAFQYFDISRRRLMVRGGKCSRSSSRKDKVQNIVQANILKITLQECNHTWENSNTCIHTWASTRVARSLTAILGKLAKPSSYLVHGPRGFNFLQTLLMKMSFQYVHFSAIVFERCFPQNISKFLFE